jgi:hypothetical protein
MKLTITRNDPSYPAYYPVSTIIDSIPDRAQLHKVLADNIHQCSDKDYISIKVMSDRGSVLYSGPASGIKGKRF